MAHPAWDTLPSVIIVEILSYLSVTDRFPASSTCKRWRNCLFQASLWRKVDFRFKYGSRKRARFLTDVVGRFVKEACIEFNSKCYVDVKDCLILLQEFGRNGNMEKLILKPASFQVSWPEHEIGRPFQKNMLDL